MTFFILFSSTVSKATVGGPQFLTYIGEKDSSLYFIYEYHDEMVSPPELWEYNIIDDSLSVSDSWINYPTESIAEALVRHGLNNLIKSGSAIDSINMSFNFLPSQQVMMESTSQYYNEYPVAVSWGDYKFTIYQCFGKEPLPKVIESYSFKKHHLKLAIVRYKGVCMETGYLKDTLLIIPQKLNPAGQNEPMNSEDGDQQPLVIGLVLLAITLMTIIFVKNR